MNEFLKCPIVHIDFSGFTTVQPKKKAKVSSDGSKARGGNCDTRLEFRGNSLIPVRKKFFLRVLIKYDKSVDEYFF